MDSFLLESVREAKVYEFERLVQTPSIIVAEYDIKFTQLAQYAKHLNLTEEVKTKQFVKGLVHPLFSSMAPRKFTSYTGVVDCARMLEAREMAKRATRDSKQIKTKTHQSGQRGQGSNQKRQSQQSRPYWQGQQSQQSRQGRFQQRTVS